MGSLCGLHIFPSPRTRGGTENDKLPGAVTSKMNWYFILRLVGVNQSSVCVLCDRSPEGSGRLPRSQRAALRHGTT